MAVSNPTGPCAESPLKWIEIEKPKIFHPIDGWVTLTPRWYQEDFLRSWTDPKRIVNKSRQIGMSQISAAEVYWKARFRGPRRILIVSRNLDQATEFIRYVRGFVQDGELVEDNKTSLTFANGSQVKAQGDTPSAGRGFAASDVYLDEYAFPRWASEIWQAISPAVSTGGTLTVFSTPYGASGRFYELWQEAGEPDSGWAIFRFPWTVLFDEAWAAETRRRLSRAEFASEHDCSFEESGDRMWRKADIDACMLPSVQAPPQDGHKYLLVADMAGKGIDSTVLLVIDTTERPFLVVAVKALSRAGNDDKIDAFHDLSSRYGIKDLHIDATGQSALDIADELTKALKAKDETLKRTVLGFTFTKKSKAEAITRLTRWIEHHDVLYDDPRIREELLRYKLPDTGLQTDHVSALMIGAHLLEKPHTPARVIVV